MYSMLLMMSISAPPPATVAVPLAPPPAVVQVAAYAPAPVAYAQASAGCSGGFAQASAGCSGGGVSARVRLFAGDRRPLRAVLRFPFRLFGSCR